MWSISWLYLLEAVVIVASNVITIVIFTTTPRLRSRQYALIVNLAVADLLVGLITAPMFVAKEEAKTPSLFRAIHSFQDDFLGTASLFSLAALAIERVHATYFPFKHASLSHVPYIVGITLVWVGAFLSGTWASRDIFADRFLHLVAKFSRIGFSISIVVFGYLLIFINVRCMATNTPDNVNHHGNRKLTITLAIVTVVSLVAWCPRQVYVLCNAMGNQCKSASFRYISKFLQYSNSFVNFVIYALRMREFRSAFGRRIHQLQLNAAVLPASSTLGYPMNTPNRQQSNAFTESNS